MRPQGAAVVAHGGAGLRAGATSTTQRPPISDALAEAPRIMATEAPPARVLASEPNTAAAPEAAPLAAAAAAKKPRAVTRASAPSRYDVPRYTAPRYEPRYDSMERGPYAFLLVRLVQSGILTTLLQDQASNNSSPPKAYGKRFRQTEILCCSIHTRFTRRQRHFTTSRPLLD